MLKALLLNWFRDKYIAALAVKGLVSPRGFVDQTILMEEFLSFFGHGTLKLLHSEIDIEKETGWLRSIVRKHRKAFHPIRHILMMQYLAESTERFLTTEHIFEPFGNPPWLCLNPVSIHYQKPVINTVRVTTCSDTGRPVGTFACSCGFVYSRRGPDLNHQARSHVGRIKVFGHLWESKLKQVLQDRSIGLREAGRIMHCDPKSIVKYAKKLGISVIWNTKTTVKASAQVDLMAINLEQRRTQWIKLTDEYPEISISLLRSKNPGLYAWLYRHDREWLRLVSPISIRCGNNNLRLNWNTRDEIILAKVMQCVQNILDSDGKPMRITVGTIGKIIGAQALLEKHLDRLSRTKSFLESSLETVEDFQCRRIRWAADVLNRRGEQVREWKIIRIAGVRPGFSQKIADEIEQQIVRYSPKKIGQVGR